MAIKCDRVLGRLYFMIIATLIYALIELIVGWLNNSATLQADGYHMLADLTALMVTLISYIFSTRPWSKSTFGWARSEILGALINSLLLFILCAEIILDAIKLARDPIDLYDKKMVLLIGSGGLIFNLFGFILLYKVDWEFSNQNSVSKTTKMNLKGAALHLLADLFSSILVIISTLIVMHFKGNWIRYVDPILSLFPALVISIAAWKLLRESAMILLQTVPSHIQVDTIKKTITNLQEVKSVHDFHLWRLSGDVIIATMHCVYETPDDYIATIKQTKHFFCSIGVHSTTIQPEFLNQPTTLEDPNDNSHRSDDNYIDHCRIASQSCEGQTCCTPSEQLKTK